jgi:phenylacetate-coenzyme A ligase PaaK-like adenylate-forming protein
LVQPVKFSPEYYSNSLHTLEYALKTVPIYRDWQKFDPGPGVHIDTRYAALPALTKKKIRENFPVGILPPSLDVNMGLASKEITLVETSGTTDDKITNIWNQKWWDASERASWQLNSYASHLADSNHREAILANPLNVGFISDEADLPFEKRRLSRFLYLNEKTDPAKWSPALMDRMIKELAEFQPVLLEANPSLLARLCRYAESVKSPVFQPELITFTYEYATHFHLRQIRRIFSSPFASSYGTTETGYVFMQCEFGKFHQNSSFCRVDFEPLKEEHGGPDLGRILVTPFNNPWSYLLRFDVGDLVILDPAGNCPCGKNSGFLLKTLAGRVANLTLTCSGRLVSLYELDTSMGKMEEIDSYQLVQTDLRSYELHLVSQKSNRESIRKQTTEILKDLYGKEAQISIIFEQDIAPERSGKYLISKALFPIEIEKYLAKSVN